MNELGLGDGAENEYDEPVAIPFFIENGIKIQSVCCGRYHSLALSEQHVVYSWGKNGDGECGMEKSGNQGPSGRTFRASRRLNTTISIPTKVDIPSDAQIITIRCGVYHSGCMSATQEVFLWGSNEDSECCV